MAVSYKIMLFPLKKRKDNTRTVVLRLTINRSRFYLGLNMSAAEKDWNEKKSRFKRTYNPQKYKEYNEHLELFENKAGNIILDFQKRKITITADSFKKSFFEKKGNNDLFEFFDERINELEEKGKIGNANTYKFSRNALRRFHKKKVLHFTDVDVKFLNKFEVYLSRTCTGNSISVYLRTLRAVFNAAVSRGLCKFEDSPFFSQIKQQGYKIKRLEKPTRKRAISLDDLKKIIEYKTEPNTSLRDMQNMFIFSFYNMGMNFIDMAYLKWENISNGRVLYQRQKTGKQFSVKILPKTQEILDYYKPFQDELGYIFPIFTDFHKTAKQKLTRKATALKKFNKEIKIIAKNAGVENPELITSYVIRHSWATIMLQLGSSKTDIGKGFKHSSEKITEIYIKELMDSSVDVMNEKLLNL